MSKAPVVLYKCPACGGECEPYDEGLFKCTSCGSICADSTDRKIIDIRDRAKIERVRFEVRQYNDKMADKQKTEDALRWYGSLPWYKKLWYRFTDLFW